MVGDCRAFDAADASAATTAAIAPAAAVDGNGEDGCEDGGDRVGATACPDEGSAADGRELGDDVVPVLDRCVVGANESSSSEDREGVIESRSFGVSNEGGGTGTSDSERPRPDLLPLLLGDNVSVQVSEQ